MKKFFYVLLMGIMLFGLKLQNSTPSPIGELTGTFITGVLMSLIGAVTLMTLIWRSQK